MLKFPRLLLGRSSQMRISVRNNGILGVQARIEMEQHPAFKLLEGSQVNCINERVGAECMRWGLGV